MSCGDFGCYDLSLTYVGMFMYISKSLMIHLYNISKVSFPSLSSVVTAITCFYPRKYFKMFT